MGNNIQLKYEEMYTVINDIKQANFCMETAQKQLAQSTDLGSSVMQAFWKFGSKEAIFGAIKKAQKKITKEMQENANLCAYLNSLRSVYEGAAKSASSPKTNIAEILKRLAVIIGITVNPQIIGSILTIWAGGTIISRITKSTKNKPSSSIASIIFPKWNNSGSTIIVPPNTTTSDIGQIIIPTTPNPITSPQTSMSDYNGLSPLQYQSLKEALKKYENARYVWAGESTDGVDCSGLVMQAYKDAGIKTDFPHRASEMYPLCKPIGTYNKGEIDTSQLKPGDLLFFSNGEASDIKHVGIYMGNGQMMHASSYYGKVVTKSIDTTGYSKIYAARVK